MAKKERMIADTPEKGHQRYSVIKGAVRRYNEALESGFFLEAITIAESLIADRLESRAIFLGKIDTSFKTLGVLTTNLKNDSILSCLIPEIDAWRKQRNNALHELAKIENGDASLFHDKYLKTKSIAEEGIKIFRKINNVLKKSRAGEL